MGSMRAAGTSAAVFALRAKPATAAPITRTPRVASFGHWGGDFKKSSAPVRQHTTQEGLNLRITTTMQSVLRSAGLGIISQQKVVAMAALAIALQGIS